MSELKMPQVGASRSEIVANWQPENPEFWEKFGIYGQPLQHN